MPAKKTTTKAPTAKTRTFRGSAIGTVIGTPPKIAKPVAVVEEIEEIAEPTAEEIQAAALGEIETERHIKREALAEAAVLPTWEPERRADHAIATARSRGR